MSQSISPHTAHRKQLQEMGDEELMKQFQDGVEEAYDILHDRYEQKILHHLHRFVDDDGKCEDLCQETFMRVYRNRHSYRPIAKFSTWLFTIAGNLGKSEYRRKKRRVMRMQPLVTENRDGETFELSLEHPNPLPDETTEGTLLLDYLLEALEEVSDEYYEVILLRDIQECSYAEIAEITGLLMGTVKSRLHRGRRELQEMLGEVYAEAILPQNE